MVVRSVHADQLTPAGGNLQFTTGEQQTRSQLFSLLFFRGFARTPYDYATHSTLHPFMGWTVRYGACSTSPVKVHHHIHIDLEVVIYDDDDDGPSRVVLVLACRCPLHLYRHGARRHSHSERAVRVHFRRRRVERCPGRQPNLGSSIDDGLVQ